MRLLKRIALALILLAIFTLATTDLASWKTITALLSAQTFGWLSKKWGEEKR